MDQPPSQARLWATIERRETPLDGPVEISDIQMPNLGEESRPWSVVFLVATCNPCSNITIYFYSSSLVEWFAFTLASI